MASPAVPHCPDGLTWVDMMNVAYEQALAAVAVDEAPIGAALFSMNGELIASAHNAPISNNDPTCHAEVRCLRRAARKIGNYRLPNTIMAVTLEPCLMCTGALIHARVSGVVIGALDDRTGAFVSNLDGHALPFANHAMWHVSGVMEKECGDLLRSFFRRRRKKRQ